MKNLIMPITIFVMLFSMIGFVNATLSINNTTDNLTGDVYSDVNGYFMVCAGNNTPSPKNVTFESTNLVSGSYLIPSSKISFDPDFITGISANSCDRINFTISLDNYYATTYEGNITANSTGTNETASFTLNLTVNESPNISLSNVSENVTVGNSKKTTLNIQNTGNTDVKTNITVSDLHNGSNVLSSSNIDIQPNIISLDYQKSETVNITINVPSTQQEGIYTGNLIASYGNKTTQSTITVDVVPQVADISFNDVSVEGLPGDDLTGSFVVTNNGTIDLNNINVSLTGLSEFNISLTPTLFNLSAGSSKTININGKIPNDNILTRIYSGTLNIGNSLVSRNKTLFVNVNDALKIINLDVKVDSKLWDDLSDGDEINGVKPDAHIRMTFKVKNEYDSDTNNDLNNVIVYATAKGIDNGDDIDVESDEFDINAGDDKTIILEWDVPLKVDEDTYDVDIYTEGEDDYGVNHRYDMGIKLKVEKDRHDIIIENAELSNNNLTCNRYTTLYTTIMNIGSTSEDKVVLDIENSGLGINFREMYKMNDNIDDDTNERKITLPISLSDSLSSGVYPINIDLYYDIDKIVDHRTVNLIVGNCQQQSNQTNQTNETNETNETINVETGNNETSTGVAVIRKISFMDSEYFVPVMVGIIAIIAILIIIEIIFIVKRR